MCEAERQVENLEIENARLGDKLTELCDHIDDAERGIIDLAELRRLAGDYRRTHA